MPDATLYMGLNTFKSPRVHWLLWLAAVGFLIALLLYPTSYRVTRAATVFFALAAWFGLIALLWKHRVARVVLLAVTLLAAGFLALPARADASSEALRTDYLAAMRRYDGVTYHWGGENSRGIDCSGLVRRGLVNAMFARGVRMLDGGLIRNALDLWWNDCSAHALGQGHRDLTVQVMETPSVNELDHSQIVPGDLAVTQSGVHIMAYLGDKQWIEADPEAGKVITLTAPSRNGWFHSPMRIVRWKALLEGK